jgi:hypothetical protein
MTELHWTGAAVLLALAVLGNGSGRPRRPAVRSWADFAREHSLDAAPHPYTWSRLAPRGCTLTAAIRGAPQVPGELEEPW